MFQPKAPFAAVVAAMLAVAAPAFAQPQATEDHPALTLNDPATTEDHPTLSIPAPAAHAQAPPPAVAPDQPQTADTPAEQPATPEAPKTAEAPPAPEPVTLQHPTVVDTAKLAGAGQTVALFGIVGLAGQFADDLHGAIVGYGDQVTCQAQTDADYMCALPDGTDVAALALRNGAAQTRDDAPDTYRELETAARDERRGVWSSLPPPPTQVQHPTVVDTATLTAAGQTYMLDGVRGLGMPYSRDLQGYIAANGDSLMCNPQGDPGHYVCLLPDGTDVAKVALVNGAARVAADAPDSYRVEQGDALANRRGFWMNASPDVLVAATGAPASAPTPYVLVPGDDGTDGISYIGGAPAVMVDGALVFLAYGGVAGWGYWDGGHHWHGAPGRYAAHMDHFHPGGAGLRGSGGAGGFHGGMHTAAAGAAPGRAPQGGFVHPGATPAASHAPMGHAPMPNVIHGPTPAAARGPAPAMAHGPTPAAVHAPPPAAARAPMPMRAPAPARVAAPARSCGKPHC